jgi:2-haloacid dehalogenase
LKRAYRPDMNAPPKVVAFDVIETLFSLHGVRRRFEAASLPAAQVEAWFAGLLRDAFALEVTGVYVPFKPLAEASLDGLLAREKIERKPGDAAEIIAGFGELDPHPDVQPAFDLLRTAGIRIITVSNGSAATTGKILKAAGLDQYVQAIISIDDMRHWKPAKEVYLHTANIAKVSPAEIMLVAAHSWDVHGARRAGLRAAYLSREGKPFLTGMEGPEIQGKTATELAAKIVHGDR